MVRGSGHSSIGFGVFFFYIAGFHGFLQNLNNFFLVGNVIHDLWAAGVGGWGGKDR